MFPMTIFNTIDLHTLLYSIGQLSIENMTITSVFSFGHLIMKVIIDGVSAIKQSRTEIFVKDGAAAFRIYPRTEKSIQVVW